MASLYIPGNVPKRCCQSFPHTTGLAGAISSSNPCAPKLNFFPTATDIDADLRRYVLLPNGTYALDICNGTDVCNFPAVWTRAAQTTAAELAGVSVGNSVLKVALKEYGTGKHAGVGHHGVCCFMLPGRTMA